MLQLFLLFVVAVSAQTAPKVATYEGYKFSFYTNEASGKLTYDDATQVCVDAGAILAEIKSADVQDFITTQLTDLGLVENWSSWAQGYWIGGACGGGKDNWKWEDGTSIGNGTYQNWFSGASCSLLEPNSNKESDRICLFQFEEGKYNFNTCNETLGKWGDVDKKTNMNWICMKAATCLNRTVTPTRDTWALEYTGQLYSVHFCTTGDPTMLTWNFQDSSGANIATIEFAADVSTTPPTPCQPPSNMPTGYSATCQYNAGCFTTTFSVEAVLSANFNHSRLNLSQEGEICFGQTIMLQECTSPTLSNVPVNPPTGVYNTPAHFQCSQNSTLFYSSGTTGNTATKCLASAEWENEGIVQCWSAPHATLAGNNTYCSGESATFNCTAAGGFPLVDKVELYFKRQNQPLNGNTWSSSPLASSNNGDVVECRAISYTSIAEYSHLGIDKQTLTVYYSARNPMIENQMSDLFIKVDSGYLVRSDETLTMNCLADGNPAVHCSWSCLECIGSMDTCQVSNLVVERSTNVMCTVDNGVCGGSEQSITQNITLVQKSRSPFVLADDDMSTVKSVVTRDQYQSLNLTCGINHQADLSTSFIWMKNEENKSDSEYLVIDNLDSADLALYSCTAYDVFGSSTTTLYLNVHYPPEQFKVTNAVNNVCEWDLDGVQSCNISFQLNPPTHVATLTKDGMIVPNDYEYIPQNTRNQQFVFIKNQPMISDHGLYKLTITSAKFGQTDHVFTIDVIVPIASLKDDTTVIVGAVLGTITTICLVIIAYLLFDRRYKNVELIKKRNSTLKRSEHIDTSLSEDYDEIRVSRSTTPNNRLISPPRPPYVNPRTEDFGSSGIAGNKVSVPIFTEENYIILNAVMQPSVDEYEEIYSHVCITKF